MNEQKKQVAIWMTCEEIAMLERIRKFVKRNTYSDTLRWLVNDMHEKILLENTAVASK